MVLTILTQQSVTPKTGSLRKNLPKVPAFGVGTPLSALTGQNRWRLVAHFRTSPGLFGEGQQSARNPATGWLRASDSKFDTHHDASLVVPIILVSQSVTPETGPLRKIARRSALSLQVRVSLLSRGRTAGI